MGDIPITLDQYAEVVLDEILVIQGKKQSKIGEFGLIKSNQEARKNVKRAMMYFLQIFGPDIFFDFMFEYKSLE